MPSRWRRTRASVCTHIWRRMPTTSPGLSKPMVAGPGRMPNHWAGSGTMSGTRIVSSSTRARSPSLPGPEPGWRTVRRRTAGWGRVSRRSARCATLASPSAWASTDRPATIPEAFCPKPGRPCCCSGSAMSAREALEMATLGGASILGRADDLGMIEAGKRADLAICDVSGLGAAGAWDPVAALVLCGPFTVRDLLVEGRWVVRDGMLSTVDPGAIFGGFVAIDWSLPKLSVSSSGAVRWRQRRCWQVASPPLQRASADGRGRRFRAPCQVQALPAGAPWRQDA